MLSTRVVFTNRFGRSAQLLHRSLLRSGVSSCQRWIDWQLTRGSPLIVYRIQQSSREVKYPRVFFFCLYIFLFSTFMLYFVVLPTVRKSGE